MADQDHNPQLKQWQRIIPSSEPGQGHIEAPGGFTNPVWQTRASVPGAFELDARALEHESVLPLLEARARLIVSHAENRLRLVRLPKPAVRIMLPDQANDPPLGLRLETFYRLADDTTVAWQIMHIPANDYRLSLRSELR